MLAVEQIFILFALILVGVVVGKKNMVSDKFKSDVSRLLLSVFLPALILKSMSFKFSNEIFNKSLKVIAVSFFVYIFSIVISRIFTKVLSIKGDSKNVYEYALIFSNSGFMGYPVLQVIYGNEGLFYGVMFNLGFTFMVWTYGVYIYERDYKVDGKKESLKDKLKHIIINPGIIAMVVGFTMFYFSIPYPAPVFKIITLLGDLTTPLSMIFIGLVLTETNIKEMFTDKFITLTSIMRLAVLPAMVYGILRLAGIDGLILYVSVVITAMPVAANTAMFAERYDSDYKKASLVIVQSTLLSVVALPLLIFLLK